MPFTPCHVLAVVPFRRRLPWLALAIGAMVPDLGYFFPWTPYFYETAHTLPRLFTFCLPMGWIAFALVEITRPGWVHLVPAAWVSVSAPAMPRRILDWIRVAAAILFGAGTHLFWDSWTHRYGYFIELWPDLPYHWLQHLSSFGAGAVLIWMLWRRFGRGLWGFTPAQRGYWVTVAFFAALWGGLRFSSPEHAGLTGQRSLFILVTSAIGAALSIVAVSSATLAWFETRRSK